MPMCVQSQRAVSVIDLAMALFGREWREGWFGMFTAYCDASGHPDNTKSLVVAGFIAPLKQWHAFDREWLKVLTTHEVKALHMKDFAHSRREFSSWKGNERKRSAFLASLISVIKRRASFSFSSGIHVEDFNEFKEQSRDSKIYSRLSSPYALAGITCVVRASEWAVGMKIPAKDLRLIFEDGDKGKGSLLDLSSEVLGITPIFEPKQYHRAFQAADLLAYETFLAQGKILGKANGLNTDLESLRKPFQSLRSIPGSAEWGYKDKAIFRQVTSRGTTGRHG